MIAPSALLFPYTDLTPIRLAHGLAFFREIIVYTLPRSHPDDYLAQALNLGLVRGKAASFIDDDQEIKRILDNFAQWAANYGQGGYMSLLQQHLAQESAESSGSRLMTAIRGQWTDPGLQQDPRSQAQILLHFAQDLDRQRYETSLILSEVTDEERRLGEIMGVELFDLEADEAEVLAHGAEPMPVADEPGLDLMPQRLMAWFRFLEAFGRDDACLFTDQLAAIETLDLNLARHRPGREQLEAGRKTEVLEPFMEVIIPAPDFGGQAPALPALAEARNQWPGWSEFLAKVAARPWPARELDELRSEAAALTPAKPDSAAPTLTLTGYLLPGQDLTEAMGAAVDLARQTGPDDFFCGPVLVLESRGV